MKNTTTKNIDRSMVKNRTVLYDRSVELKYLLVYKAWYLLQTSVYSKAVVAPYCLPLLMYCLLHTNTHNIIIIIFLSIYVCNFYESVVSLGCGTCFIQ